jgi:hypothetical protein
MAKSKTSTPVPPCPHFKQFYDDIQEQVVMLGALTEVIEGLADRDGQACAIHVLLGPITDRFDRLCSDARPFSDREDAI